MLSHTPYEKLTVNAAPYGIPFYHRLGFKDTGKIILKESGVSVICGIILAVANYIKIMLFDNLVLDSNVSAQVAIVVCLTLVVTVVAAKIIGCTLPLIAKTCHLDPAVMASPFITTIVDVLSLLIFCNLAIALL